MIAFLDGILDSKETGSAVLEVNGVGYRVEISNQTYEKLPGVNEKVKLLIHHHITDSDQRLFGFFSRQEKTLFEKLITVKGIGPKLGLTILSGIQADELVDSIIRDDQQALSRISGIGKKTAGRIVLELKDKIFQGHDSGSKSTSGVPLTDRDEAVSALEALGFRKREAEEAVSKISREVKNGSVQDLVKRALTMLNK